MRLTTKGRFAVTAMIDLAMRQGSGPVSLSAISARQQISLSYLEQLFAKLRKQELVESTRGPGGGYRLGRAASEITVAEIISSVDEQMDATQCGGQENCQADGSRCMTHELWASLNSQMLSFLNGISLEKLANEQLAKGHDLNAEVKPLIQNLKKGFSNPSSKVVKTTAPNSVFALGGLGGLGQLRGNFAKS